MFHFDVGYSVHPELVVAYENIASPQYYEVDPTERFHVLKTRAKGIHSLELIDMYTNERFVCEAPASCFAQVKMDHDQVA